MIHGVTHSLTSSHRFTSKMALALHLHSPLLSLNSRSRPHRSTTTTITCQTSSSSSTPEPDKPVPSSGQGFGPRPAQNRPSKNKGKGAKRESEKVIRRAPIAKKPELLGLGRNEGGEVEGKGKESSRGEDVFLLAWLGLGGVILVEGVTLAASGFLPEEWDKFLVKFIYPIFTPTVFLFVAGSVGYGVINHSGKHRIHAKAEMTLHQCEPYEASCRLGPWEAVQLRGILRVEIVDLLYFRPLSCYAGSTDEVEYCVYE
ncbi:LPA2-like protein [Drosera capensis]